MRTTDLIRTILDLIDSMDSEQTSSSRDDRPHDQIKDLVTPIDNRDYSTEPDEQYASVDVMTIGAGGGVNGPKDPADIRVKDPRGYE